MKRIAAVLMAAVCLFPMLRIPVLKGAAAETGKQLAELRITTANGLSPTFDIIRAPEDFWGVSVTNRKGKEPDPEGFQSQ